MFFHDLGSNCFLFQFFHERDILRVEKGVPWSFYRHLLLSRRLGITEKPMDIPIYVFSIWLQVYDLLVGFRSEKVCATIGDFAGRYIELDPCNFDGSCKEFIRIRIQLDVRQSLKQQTKMKRKGRDWFYAKFQFEKLPTFCFFCGIIGHSEQVCEKLYDDPNATTTTLPYSPQLRASLRKTNVVDNSCWTRQGRGQPCEPAVDGGNESMQVDMASTRHGKSNHVLTNSGIVSAGQWQFFWQV